MTATVPGPSSLLDLNHMLLMHYTTLQRVYLFSFLQIIRSVIQRLIYTILRIHPVPYSVLAPPHERGTTPVLNPDHHCQMETDPACS